MTKSKPKSLPNVKLRPPNPRQQETNHVELTRVGTSLRTLPAFRSRIESAPLPRRIARSSPILPKRMSAALPPTPVVFINLFSHALSSEWNIFQDEPPLTLPMSSSSRSSSASFGSLDSLDECLNSTLLHAAPTPLPRPTVSVDDDSSQFRDIDLDENTNGSLPHMRHNTIPFSLTLQSELSETRKSHWTKFKRFNSKIITSSRKWIRKALSLHKPGRT
jgi:hypothetical protein